MPLPAPVQLSPAAPCRSLEPAPGAQTAAGIQPLPPWLGCVPLVGREGPALQPLGVAQETAGLASRLN